MANRAKEEMVKFFLKYSLLEGLGCYLKLLPTLGVGLAASNEGSREISSGEAPTQVILICDKLTLNKQ